MKSLHAALDTSWGFSLALEEEPGKLLFQDQLTAVGRERDRLLIPWMTQCLEKAGYRLHLRGGLALDAWHVRSLFWVDPAANLAEGFRNSQNFVSLKSRTRLPTQSSW